MAAAERRSRLCDDGLYKRGAPCYESVVQNVSSPRDINLDADCVIATTQLMNFGLGEMSHFLLNLQLRFNLAINYVCKTM